MDFDESVRIARSPSEVFGLLADVQRWAVHPGSPITAMEKLPAGPTAVGTRWREVVRLGPWLRMTIWSEVTDIEPGVMLAERFWGGSMRGTLIYTLQADDGGALLRQRESMATVGWLRPLDGVMGRMLERRLGRRLLDIRDQLEGRI